MTAEELETLCRAEGYRIILLPRAGLAIWQRDAGRIMGFSLRKFYDVKAAGLAPPTVRHNGKEWITLAALAAALDA